MMTFHVRVKKDRAASEIRQLEVKAASEAAARRLVQEANPGCVIVEVTDPLHATRVKVAQAVSGFAAYSKDPRIKALAVFSLPVAELAVSIGEEVERQVNAGIKNTQDIAQSIFKALTR